MGVVDIVASIKSLFGSVNTKQSEILFNQWKAMYEKQEARAKELEAKLDEAMKMLLTNGEKVKKLIEMEEQCLQQNVRANEFARNLAEYIIFSGDPEKIEDVKYSLKKLLKG